jgi:hypothetical protein
MALIPSYIPGGDLINQAVTNFLEGGQVGIESMRRIDWEKKYLWTLDFVDFRPPAPFDNFFPASDVSFPMGFIEDLQIEFGQNDFRFPVKSKSKELTITFYDDENRTVIRWMRDWMELDLMNYGQFVSGLDDNHNTVEPDMTGNIRPVQPVRHMRLALLQHFKREVITFDFRVYPVGELTYSGSQESAAGTYSMTFVVAEEIGKKSKPTRLNLVNEFKQILARFI